MSLPESPQQVITPPPELPATPRPLNRAVKSLGLSEPRVRAWLILSAAFLVITLYFAITKLSEWASDRSLVLSGAQTQATITGIDGVTQRLNQRKPWTSLVQLEYVVASGEKITAESRLSEQPPSSQITLGDKIDIRYDKNNPSRWTDRKTPPGFAHALVVVYILAAVTLATTLFTLLQRRRLFKTWTHGQLTPAAVLSSTNSPIAPTYTHLTVSPQNKAPLSVYLPKRLGNPQKGEVIWLLTTPGGLPVAARVFL